MAQSYGQIKKMKTAKIGTIMPWAGSGSTSTLIDGIPQGWVLCDGRVYQADRYPLLSSVLGNSYGGTTVTGDFPHYLGTIKVPDITGKVMMDLEPFMLTQAPYNAGQLDAYSKLVDDEGEPLVIDDGLTKTINTLLSADTDLAFTVDIDINFVGKMTNGPAGGNITVSDPAFTTTTYLYPRKLGINHMPYHRHPGAYEKALAGGPQPELFAPDSMSVGGNKSIGGGCGTVGWYEASLNNPGEAPTWCNGAGLITYFDDNTLIETFQFNEFISDADNDYSQTPPSNVDQVTYQSPNAYTSSFTGTPVTTHAQKAWTGMFPRPQEFTNRRNYFGFGGSVGPTGLGDDPEAGANAYLINLTVTGGANTITLPAGTNIGPNYDGVVPNMIVSSATTGSVYIRPGTQILSIARTGTVNSYEYVLELDRSIFGAGSATLDIYFRHGTYPTTMNATPPAQDPAGNVFGSHNHGSFEIIMGGGTLKGPTTHPVNNISKGDVAPQTIEGALNISANIACPSQNFVFIIRAF